MLLMRTSQPSYRRKEDKNNKTKTKTQDIVPENTMRNLSTSNSSLNLSALKDGVTKLSKELDVSPLSEGQNIFLINKNKELEEYHLL